METETVPKKKLCINWKKTMQFKLKFSHTMARHSIMKLFK